jgi:hypothetical protein
LQYGDCIELRERHCGDRLRVGTELMVHISAAAVRAVQGVCQMQHPAGGVRMATVLAPICMHGGFSRSGRRRGRPVPTVEMRVADTVQQPGRLSRQQAQHHPRGKPVQRAARLQSTQCFGQQGHGGSLTAWLRTLGAPLTEGSGSRARA